MNTLLDHLETVIETVRGEVATTLGEGQIIHAADSEVTDALALAAELHRLAEAVMVEATGEVIRRSWQHDRDLRLTSRMGCHDVSELVQRLTRVSPATASRLQRAGKATMSRVSLAWEAGPGEFPAMHEALLDGVVGIDGVLAVTGPLQPVTRRIGRDNILLADGILAAEARGEGPEGAPPACADTLKVQAHAWAAALDEDGAAPNETDTLRLREITLGLERDGLVPIRGNLLPEVAAQFRLISDATGNPRVQNGQVVFQPSEPDDTNSTDAEWVPDDLRTAAQKRHDALATALFAAASSQLLPTIGGAAPTLVISVRQEDLATGMGWAHVDGTDQPLPITSAWHAACAGVIQRVLLAPDGRIVRIGTEERVFNKHQRRAIALRDGGCIIPGCGVPAAWCEIHHVVDWANGGPTHTDNGVLLCWYHHRFLDTNGWRIRMTRGVPEVKAPDWIEPRPKWRAVTKSRTRILDHIARRT